eukprot:526240_1
MTLVMTPTNGIQVQQNDVPPPLEPTDSSKSIVSILKPQSVSLEPKDIRTRTQSNTPRKVQFTIVEGKFGGRGLTEYQKTPQRKSHTKRQLPIGMFDKDLNTDADLSDIDETSVFKPHLFASSSLLDNMNSKKYMANSRLVRLVQRKKKRKQKEEQWLTMISPDVGLYHKTRSKVQQMAPPPLIAVSNQSTQFNTDRFKSPSHYMSRGRRALYKAQKQMNKKNTANIDRQKALLVKGTPIVNKVSRIAMRMRNAAVQMQAKESAVIEDKEDVVMNHGNNGSIPPELVNNEIASELLTNHLEIEMKDNSPQQNSPRITLDEDEETHSDEQKVEDETEEETENASRYIPFDNGPQEMESNECGDDSEDDDLLLNKLLNKFTEKATSDVICDEINVNEENVARGDVMDVAPVAMVETNDAMDEAMKSKSPSQEQGKPQQLDFDIVSPSPLTSSRPHTDHSHHVVPESPQMVIKYTRSIGTQTQYMQCEIGIQTGNGAHTYSLSKAEETPLLVRSNEPMVIITSCGTKFMQIIEDTENIEELESLTLEIDKENVMNTTRKRRFNETMWSEEEHCNQAKRRRVDDSLMKKKKYQKQDLIWTSYNGDEEPAMILNCEYEENERFYPSKYELLWLNWTDTTDENGRKGECSITIELPTQVKGEIDEKAFDELFRKKSISEHGWKEIQRYRADLYNKYYGKRHTRGRKVKRKRRASVI